MRSRRKPPRRPLFRTFCVVRKTVASLLGVVPRARHSGRTVSRAELAWHCCATTAARLQNTAFRATCQVSLRKATSLLWSLLASLARVSGFAASCFADAGSASSAAACHSRRYHCATLRSRRASLPFGHEPEARATRFAVRKLARAPLSGSCFARRSVQRTSFFSLFRKVFSNRVSLKPEDGSRPILAAIAARDAACGPWPHACDGPDFALLMDREGPSTSVSVDSWSRPSVGLTTYVLRPQAV